jgi:hypothetical protein
MITAPRDPESGEDILEWAREITRVVRAVLPRSSGDILAHTRSTGTAYVFRPRPPRATDGSPPIPLSPYDASSGEDAFVGITPGTFGGNAESTVGTSVPTIDSVRIDDATPPALALGEDDVLIYLQADVGTDGLITATSIHSTEDADPPANTASTCYVRLATCVVTLGDRASVAFGVPNLRGSQAYELCGGVTHLHRLV